LLNSSYFLVLQGKQTAFSKETATLSNSAQALADIRSTPRGRGGNSGLAPDRSFQSPHSHALGHAAESGSSRSAFYNNNTHASNQSHEVMLMCRRANSAVEVPHLNAYPMTTCAFSAARVSN